MRRGCIHCGWNGHPHLCGCIAKLGEAIRSGDLEVAREQFARLVGDANADEIRRREVQS